MITNPMSALEQEFELETVSMHQSEENEYSYETDHEEDECNCKKNSAFELNNNSETGDEFESDEEFESGDDMEMDDEFESDEESEPDDEFEMDDELEALDETDYAAFSRDNNYDRDREFESKIYNALVTHRDNELEFEMELDAVLHEMERDYFFGAAKKWLKKKGLKSLKKFAMNRLPLSGALKAISAIGRGDIRALLKNKLLQTAAGFIPGAGPLVSKAMSLAGNLSNAADDAKSKIQNVVQIGKDAYQDLANSIPDAQNEFEVRRNARQAFRTAVKRNPLAPGKSAGKVKETVSVSPNSRVTVYPDKISINKGQRIIPLKQGSIVSVRPGSVVIWKSR